MKQQFGQITPPADPADEFVPLNTPSAQTTVTEAADGARTKKLERARNAAHQRHAKTNRLRRKSKESKPVPSDNTGGEAGIKTEKCYEKNRLAAAKCRAKKKKTFEDVKMKHRKSGDVIHP